MIGFVVVAGEKRLVGRASRLWETRRRLERLLRERGHEWREFGLRSGCTDGREE